MSSSTKLRWKKYINELRFAHEELEISKEISKSAGPDFQDFYELYCIENNIDLAQLNSQNADRLAELYNDKSPSVADDEAGPQSNQKGALVVHKSSVKKNINSNSQEIGNSKDCDYQMTKDEKEIHDAFHKVFKKLAMLIHPDKLSSKLTTTERESRLESFKQAKDALEKRKYFTILDIAQNFDVTIPKNYKQQIRWMKKETEILKQQIAKEKSTYNYVFADCETDEEKSKLIKNFLSQVFGI